MYVCRTLSYKGAEFEVIEAPLEENMMVWGLLLYLDFLFVDYLINLASDLQSFSYQ